MIEERNNSLDNRYLSNVDDETDIRVVEVESVCENSFVFLFLFMQHK